jgi:predicted enzyme related to lactoylglutathione lyase
MPRRRHRLRAHGDLTVKLWFNLFCKDIEAQKEFYRKLLGLVEISTSRSAIYRALDGPHFQLGFNAHAAYALLNLEPPAASVGASQVSSFPTFVLEEPLKVDAACLTAIELGATALKNPFTSHYGQRQTVLADPEGNVLRLAAAA